MRDLRAAGASDLGFVAGGAGVAGGADGCVARADVVKAAQASLPRVVKNAEPYAIPGVYFFFSCSSKYFNKASHP